jgi:N-acetylglutamate synthase-like GNAT family acetyltransferase
LIVRDASVADVPQIAALLRFLGHPIEESLVIANLERLAALQETPLVAEDHDEVLGLIGLHVMVTVHRDSAVGRIPVLVVREGAQGRGIGRMLVEAVEARLRQAGCKLIEVTSNNSRVDAHLFYERLGYEKTSSRFMKRL